MSSACQSATLDMNHAGHKSCPFLEDMNPAREDANLPTASCLAKSGPSFASDSSFVL